MKPTDQTVEDFASVPPADDAAIPDPGFVALRGDSNLPQTYLPPAMAGQRRPWVRVVALVLVGVFLAATAAGICLTYGPPLLGA